MMLGEGDFSHKSINRARGDFGVAGIGPSPRAKLARAVAISAGGAAPANWRASAAFIRRVSSDTVSGLNWSGRKEVSMLSSRSDREKDNAPRSRQFLAAVFRAGPTAKCPGAVAPTGHRRVSIALS